MNRRILITLAASTMTVAGLSGCTVSSGGVDSAAAAAPSQKQAARHAKQAQKALSKGKYDAAIEHGELAVAGAPYSAENRVLLGKAYMNAGRFASAEQTFMDAMELGHGSSEVVISLAMSRLGQGEANKAMTILRDNQNIVPASDYGLALALAGDADYGVEVLTDAIRSDNVTARTRQNLALSYALAGRWREAKLMAMQDIDPSQVDSRIMEWAQIARPGAYEARVASLLGISPAASDPGQPTRLALVQPDPAAAVLAQQAAAPAPVAMASNSSAELAAIGPAPRARNLPAASESNMKVESVDLPASNAAPMIHAATQPVRVAPVADQKVAEVKKAAAIDTAFVTETATKPIAIAAVQPQVRKVAQTTAEPAPEVASGPVHLVQLGAFSTPDNAQRAWGILSAKYPELKNFRYASARVNVKGKTLYRLAAFGFGNQTSAVSMCDGIKSRGGACIVRQTNNVNPNRMASKKLTQVASR